MLHRGGRFLTLSKSKELIVVRLFLSLGLACIDTVWSLYMDGFGLSESTIGFISASLVLVTLSFAFLSTPILEYFKQTKLLVTSLLISIVAYVTLGLLNSFIIFIFMAIILALMDVLRVTCFNIIFRDNTKTSKLNAEEGFLFAILNIGWLVAPLVAGFFLVAYGVSTVFYVSAIFFGIALTSFLLFHIKNIKKKHDKFENKYVENIKRFAKNKNVRLPYFMMIGLAFGGR